MKEFFIVDDCDAPKQRMIAVLSEDGNLYYTHPKLIGHGPMHGRRATNVKEFGFEIEEEESGTYKFTKTSRSTATYPDGQPRRWQDTKMEFTITLK